MGKTNSKLKLQAKLCRPLEGGSWTFLRLPQEASNQLPTRSMVSVEGTLNGCPFQACLQPDGNGGHWLKVEPALSEQAGIGAGEVVEVELSPAAIEPEPMVPEDLQAALAEHPAALAGWNATTAIARRDWISWMTSGKKAETRNIRLEKMMDMLGKGKRRVCCFDRSGMYSKGFACPTAADESEG